MSQPKWEVIADELKRIRIDNGYLYLYTKYRGGLNADACMVFVPDSTSPTYNPLTGIRVDGSFEAY